MKKIITLAILISSSLLTGCLEQLPSCDSSDTRSVISDITKSNSLEFIDLKETEEIAYNKDKDIRLCRANLITTDGSEYIQYHIKWENNKKKDYFYVEITNY